MRAIALTLLLAACATVSGESSYEWIGVFDVSDDTSHTWSAQKVDGDYADPAMYLVLIATSTPTEATMESLEDSASTLMDGTCTDVSAGDTLTPTTAGVCYNLNFDSSSSTSTFTIDTSSVTGLVIAGQHVPLEFEYDQHYLYNSAGVDNEPIAEEGGLRYAHFTCSSDGTLVSYGEECSDDACTDCVVADTNVASGSCYMAGSYVHTVTCNAAGTEATINIYEDHSVSCSSVSSSDTPSQIHYHESGLCEVEEHDHSGDSDDGLSAAGRAFAPLGASVLVAAGALFFAL